MSKLVSLTVALAVVTLAAVGPAAAAPPSATLSPQAWQTYHGFQGLGVMNVDLGRPARAHAALQRLAARCAALPGQGVQSGRIRTICTDTALIGDRIAVAQMCGAKAGGGDTATGVCTLAQLPRMNRDFAGGARASGAVAATLAPGRCRAAFAGEQAGWSEAASSGRAFLRALDGNDVAALDQAGTRWQDALTPAFERPLGVGDRGCRPTARH